MEGHGLQPLFCRIGTKKTLVDKILPLIPDHKLYVETMVGGGAVFWNKSSAEKSIINDLDKNLIKSYRILKKADKEAVLSYIPVNETESVETRIKKIQAFVDKKPINEYEQMLQFLYTSCNTFGGLGKGKIYKENIQKNKIKRLEEYQEMLKNTTILSQDYKSVIKKYDAPSTFFFIDPPYEESKGLYKAFTFDFEELRDVLSKIKGTFMLTLNDSPNIRSIFREFNIKSVVVPAGTKAGTGNVGSKDRKEVIIMNYNLR